MFLGAAGNFLCPASALSFNAFKTVMDIDTLGTFNTSKVLFEKYFRVSGFWQAGKLHKPTWETLREAYQAPYMQGCAVLESRSLLGTTAPVREAGAVLPILPVPSHRALT